MDSGQFKDEDFVYVDPEKREVVGLVQWTESGDPLPKEREYPEDEVDEKGKKKRKKRRFPWGTFATMNRIFKLKGKSADKENEEAIDLETAISKAQEEPYWD